MIPGSHKLNIQNSIACSAPTTGYSTQSKQNGTNSLNLVSPNMILLRPQVGKPSKSCFFNARSICNKSLMINDFNVENNIEFLCITETWMNINEISLKTCQKAICLNILQEKVEVVVVVVLGCFLNRL